jgi:hypothetical protein
MFSSNKGNCKITDIDTLQIALSSSLVENSKIDLEAYVAGILALEDPTSNAIIKAISKKSGLFELDLSNTPLTKADVDSMGKTLPWKVIFSDGERIAYNVNLELLYPEFCSYLAENEITIEDLLVQPLTQVLIDADDVDEVGTNVEALFLVKNYAPAGFNLANYVNLKVLAMFDGTMTSALLTIIQNLAKQQKKLEALNLNTTSLGNNAFQGCTSITKVTLPNVTSIPASAFQVCTALISIDCPLVTNIERNAFEYCSSLPSIDCPLATSIGNYAFGGGCSSLQSCNFGSLTSIGSNAFGGAKELVDFSGITDTTSLGDSCFSGCSKLCTLGNTLNEINLHTTSIGNNAFQGCTSIKKVNLPNITSISNYAFYGCTALTSIDCPLVTSIGVCAFEGTALPSIDCPLVTSIGTNVFRNCLALQSCNFGPLTSIGSGAFSGCTLLNPIPSIDIGSSN